MPTIKNLLILALLLVSFELGFSNKELTKELESARAEIALLNEPS